MKNAKHIVKTVLFCGTLAVFSAVSVFSPKEKGSFYENRRLAVFPVPSVETVMDGTFFSNFAHFGFISILLLSVLFSVIFVKTKSLLLPIGLHMFWDFLMMMVY